MIILHISYDTILHISYDTRYQHQCWWCSCQSSLAVCMRSMVRILILCIFLQDVLYAYIRLYTDLYPDTQCLYTYILSCSSIHVPIVYNKVYRVLLVCMLIYPVYTSIYWFVLSTAAAFCQVFSFLRDFRQTKENIVYQSTGLYILQHFLMISRYSFMSGVYGGFYVSKKQCYSRSADKRKQVYLMVLRQVVSFLRDLR